MNKGPGWLAAPQDKSLIFALPADKQGSFCTLQAPRQEHKHGELSQAIILPHGLNVDKMEIGFFF